MCRVESPSDRRPFREGQRLTSSSSKATRRAIPIVDFVAIAAGIIAAVVHPPAAVVERVYSRAWYPALQHLLTPVTSLVPFALGDVLALLLIAGLFLWALRQLRKSRARLRALGRIAVRLAAIAGFLLVWFELGWGLNYDRLPLVAKIAYTASDITPTTYAALVNRVRSGLNATVAAAHADDRSDADLRVTVAQAFPAVVERLGAPPGFRPAVPKVSVFDPYFEASGTTGFTDPFTLETVLARDLNRYERPFVTAHEWGHLAGFSSETAANYIAALTMLRSPEPLLRYSGWLEIYFYLPAADASALKLDPLVAADVTAIRAGYARRMNRSVATAGWAIYNGYLHANHVRSGVASYGAFIDLLVGTKLDAAGLPLARR